MSKSKKSTSFIFFKDWVSQLDRKIRLALDISLGSGDFGLNVLKNNFELITIKEKGIIVQVKSPNRCRFPSVLLAYSKINAR